MGRIEKVNQQLKREVGNIILKELSDPRVKFVSVTNVRISKDLKNAKIFFSVLENIFNPEEALLGLESARGYMRKLLGGKMAMRYTPELHFYFDKSLEYSSTIDKTLKEISDEREKNNTGN